MNQSSSSFVRDVLLLQEEGYSFTVEEFLKKYQASNEFLTAGGISGICFRMDKAGIVSTSKDKDTGNFRYTLTDRSELSTFKVKELRGVGSQPGEHKNHHRRSVPLTPASLAQRILEFAQEVEMMTPDIKNIPTSELLKELMRREVK